MPLVNNYQDNISNVLPLQDYGIRISKAGFDANTAADKDLLYDSAWPSIQIVKVIPFTGSTFVFPHGLDFPPLAILMRLDGTTIQGVMTSPSADEINVYIPTSSSDPGTIIIYNINLSVDVEYPYTTKSGAAGVYNPDYGIKMVKTGLPIESTDMRDYILHSKCGSPLVLAVKTESTSNPANPTVVQYTNRIGYPTLNFGFIRFPARTSFGSVTFQGTQCYLSAPLQSQSFPQTFTDGTTVYIQFGTGGSIGGSVVVLRNPVFSATNTVSVTY